MIVVVDADVVIGALDASDAHHTRARRHFEAWRADGTQRVMSLVTLTEVLIAPAASTARMSTAREAIAALEIAFHAPNEAVAVDAARLRGKYPISLPGAYALATARQLGAALLSFDRKIVRTAADLGLADPG
ncbi:MAG TPA: PIN domain-containing protein [Solirubrobacteraceae bacterium]